MTFVNPGFPESTLKSGLQIRQPSRGLGLVDRAPGNANLRISCEVERRSRHSWPRSARLHGNVTCIPLEKRGLPSRFQLSQATSMGSWECTVIYAPLRVTGRNSTTARLSVTRFRRWLNASGCGSKWPVIFRLC